MPLAKPVIYADDGLVTVKTIQDIKTVLEKLEKFSQISGMKISSDKLRISKIGRDLCEDEVEYLRSIGINEKSTTRKINFLGHTIIPNQQSTDKEKTEDEAFTLRKKMTKAIVRCRKNIRLSIVGRSNAAKSLAATHIDPTIHYPIKKHQIQEAQKIYDNYVIGTTKLGARNSKYMSIKKGGASCIDIIEYSKAARLKVLHEAVVTENQLASTFFG